MTIRITAFLADSAEAGNGKLYVLGAGWDTLTASAMPLIQPRVAIGVIVHVGWNDTEVEHDVGLRLETEDGEAMTLGTQAGVDGPEPVIQIGQRFVTGRHPLLSPGDDQTYPLTFTMNNLRVPRAGGYSWALFVDQELALRLPMRVIIDPALAI
ncbi:hypothetical protein C5C03_00020 [Clavibacter michiganensis]|uniref:DUF6941 family protein n=1 Tax=Clavibacter michiganensis TaxID=28447 RepID=UPI000CE7B586|nr:hypothetical protein [Clavibacter michiganensis]PPF91250.1 hypothetical protein C5C03_00020 [Clavibacter michiganensis]PPF99292.1 hypothetical protein C5C05_01825 [Clavibacter michiganensis]